MQMSTNADLLNWIRTTNQSGAGMLQLKAQVAASQPLNDLQLTYARRMQRTEAKRQGWVEQRQAGYAA